MIDRPVTSFAYPFGGRSDYTDDTIALVREIGLSCACTNDRGAVTASADPYQFPRIHVNDLDGDRFLKMISEWLPVR